MGFLRDDYFACAAVLEMRSTFGRMGRRSRSSSAGALERSIFILSITPRHL